jgi:hypothetical protein
MLLDCVGIATPASAYRFGGRRVIIGNLVRHPHTGGIIVKHDTHPLSLTDLPHALRIAGSGVVLDAGLRFTTHGTANTALLTSMMPHTSHHTLVARFGGQRAMGQFYITPDGRGAQMVYLAPQLQPGKDDSAWLLVLDAMVREAGRRGAHTLMAELDETSPLFTCMRQSGFAVYARQQVWATDTRPPAPTKAVQLRPATPHDAIAVSLLYQRTVPSMLQQVSAAPEPFGWVYEEDGQVVAFFGVTAGRDAVYITPLADHRMQANPADLLAAVFHMMEGRPPIVVRVRRFQGWLNRPLETLGLTCIAKQAVMVRQIAAGIRTPDFAPLSRKLATGTAPRRTERVPEVCIDVDSPEVQTLNKTWTIYPDSRRVSCDGLPHTTPQRHALRPDGGRPR